MASYISNRTIFITEIYYYVSYYFTGNSHLKHAFFFSIYPITFQLLLIWFEISPHIRILPRARKIWFGLKHALLRRSIPVRKKPKNLRTEEEIRTLLA
jgi:hypothetical protein